MNTDWSCKLFNELSVNDFHDMIRLREKVFVVEQNCPYLDVDGKDPEALHVIGKSEKELIATARILLPGVSYDEIAIGRVVVDPDWRGKNIGKELMEQTMGYIEKQFGSVPVRISAQTYLLRFYEDIGFQPVGEPYLEDNIPHIQMLFLPKK